MFTLLVMSALLGVSSFLSGILPLSFALSKHHVARFSTLGSGILIGTALGVIIPEGIETLASAHAADKLPTSTIALSLIAGFTFMMVVEQLVAPHAPGNSHSHGSHAHPSASNELPLHAVGATVEFDAEMGDAEQPDGAPRSGGQTLGFMQVDMDEMRASRARAYPLTFGLITHGLADGLALGVSSLSSDPAHSDLSLIVFLALIIHKAPTSLALTTSLLNTSLPPRECRRHLAVFASSTPVGAIASYALLTFFGAGADGGWTGVALLVSGGTFLYVATVLQDVSHAPDAGDAGADKPPVRVGLVALGMFLPYLISHVVLPDVH
ncbi:Zinc/iron permease [Mycena rosella]|uniref:Zinc/iron permease n=1 Tax=Mycena rosella TaxID=1033263 RepID=A0AAD7D7F1_MYCRO|nr:Zinc/iron permease [Mycena rosella]